MKVRKKRKILKDNLKKFKNKKTCKYCKHFDTATKREQILEEEGRYTLTQNIRECPVKNNKVNEKDEACENFITADYFWCDKDNNRLKIIMCLARRERNDDGCVRCRQGKLIEEINK